MKALSIILTCALFGVIVWHVLDSRSHANQLDLLRLQQKAKGATSADDKQLAALESQLVAEQMNKKAPAPSSGPIFPASVTPPMPNSTIGRTPAITSALQAANAAPLPPSPRQRLIASAPRLAEVKEYQKDYGFVVISAGATRKIEKGMGFAIRRQSAIIGRVNVTDVEGESAVAEVVPRSVPPGVLIETGDEVIQDLPPES